MRLHGEAEARSSLQKLESTPHRAELIKHLHLKERGKPWIRRSEALPTVLALLAPYTISLEIYQRRNDPARPRFDYPSLSRLVCLEQIYLSDEADATSYDNALPTFLNHFPKLRAITFEGCTVQNQLAIGGDNGVAPPAFQLKEMDIVSCGDAVVLDWLVPALSSLQILCISKFNPVVLKFITTAGRSLKYLEVRQLSSTSDEDTRLLMNAITHATNLRSLKLTAAGCALVSKRSPIQVAAQALLLTGTHAHLRELTIIIPNRNAIEDSDSWNQLEDLLLRAHFPTLRRVECRLVTGDKLILLTRPEAILGAVPRLAQRRMLYVSTSDWFD
ncbi:hypothetical protein DXG01_009017 [Tephrocybe rancida]|nr:hypothetical protein DXG01_009017 [Tephrocybe rancida]